MNTQKLLLLFLVAIFSSCNNDSAPEIATSPGAILDVPVGGPNQPNQVYIQLSSDQQTTVNKSNWDLGFYSGGEDKVILNAASEVMAREVMKSELSEVTPADYEGFKDQTTVDAVFSNLFGAPPYPDWFLESNKWIDAENGDLSETAIKLSSGNVYYIHRGFTPEKVSRGEYLVKITISGKNYSVEYTVPGSTKIESLTIPKIESHNLSYFNFDEGVITIAPSKNSWDIAFTTYMEKLDVGGGLKIPYRFQDYVIQNRNGVGVATIEIDENENLLDEYQKFAFDEISSLNFYAELNSIGSNWRTVASPTPGSVTGVKEDRFYIIKDTRGNYYKMLFTQMLSNSGERGFPQITYELVK